MISSIPIPFSMKSNRLWVTLGIGLCLLPHFGCHLKSAEQHAQNVAPKPPQHTAQTQAPPQEDPNQLRYYQGAIEQLEAWKAMRMQELASEYPEQLERSDPTVGNLYVEAISAKYKMEKAQGDGDLQQAHAAQDEMITFINRAIEAKQMHLTLRYRRAMAEAVVARQVAEKMIEFSQKYLRSPSLSTYQTDIAKANESYQKAEAEAKRVLNTEEYTRWVMEYKAKFGLR